MTATTQQTGVRKPRIADVPGIKTLLDEAAGEGELLPRTSAELYEMVRDFQVFEDEDGRIGGCCALHIDMSNLAEIRSIVVRPESRGKHVGAQMVTACLAEARTLGIARVYALTRVPGFFEKEGFHVIDKHDLPTKVFRDCVRCPSFPDCDEIAVALDIDATEQE
ncbi:MAG: N-acetyltransferase [bacterium]|nr:N-acetyltransferase [bacterium]